MAAAVTKDSPLTQQARPNFQPKIVALYETLFKEDDIEPEKSEGFWTEFFLLKPYPPGMAEVLRPISGEDLLHMQPTTRQLFGRAVQCMKSGKSPMDEFALDTLSVFLREILSKKYTNISSDIILLLSGLDSVDSVFTDFVASLDNIIKGGRTVELKRKAIQVALSLACGAFQTGLLSYFTHRDLFPALMKYIQDPDCSGQTIEPFVLLGILSNYNKFEMQNPYQLRLNDFVNEITMRRLITDLGRACIVCRADYIAIQDDLPEGWSLNSMLSYVGLTVLQGGKGRPAQPETLVDGSKLNFSELPGSKAAVLLSAYDFVRANKLFCYNLVNSKKSDEPLSESPIASYISLTSYLTQHAHRSQRTAIYARLNLIVLRILLEDDGICKRLVVDDTKTSVRLCRQRQPYLPVVRGDRILLTAVLDVITDTLSHNLRKRLDTELYLASLTLLSRIFTYLVRTRTKLSHHWSELWKSLLSLLKFLTTHMAEIEASNISQLNDLLISLLAKVLRNSDAFLPSSSASDDLFYKLVENGEVLTKFQEVYNIPLDSRPGQPDAGLTANLKVLSRVLEHYRSMLKELGKKQLSPQQVDEVIKKGYESLEIDEGIDSRARTRPFEEKYRESENKSFLKRAARVTVKDAREMCELEANVKSPRTSSAGNVELGGRKTSSVSLAGSR